MRRRQRSAEGETSSLKARLLESNEHSDAPNGKDTSVSRIPRRGSLRDVNLETVLNDTARMEDQNRHSNNRQRIAQTPLSFVDEFELINGVPAFVLEAENSAEAAAGCEFTCHAFSDNGEWLAAGDTHGGIRVWNTKNFRQTGACRMENGDRVGCVRFVARSPNELVACDIFGKCTLFNLDGREPKRWELQSVREIQQRCFVFDDELAVTVAMDPTETIAKLWTPFASDDGTVLGQAVSCRASYQSFLCDGIIFLNRMDRGEVEMTSITCSYRRLFSRIALSGNGHGLLAVYARPLHHDVNAGGEIMNNCLEVWPTVSYEQPNQFSHKLPCLMGVWANQGEYVIGWSSGIQDRDTEVIVWKTSTLQQSKSRHASTAAHRHMEKDDVIFQVEMIAPGRQDPHSDIVLAICFAEENEGKLCIHIWAAKQNAILHELPTHCHFKDTLVGRRQYLSQPEVMGYYWGHNEHVLERSLTKIQLSPEREWIAFYSSENNNGYLWSRRNAIPVAKLDLPRQFSDDGEKRVVDGMKTTAFCPSGNSVLLIGRHRMIAFVPAFLQKDTGHQMTQHHSLDDTYVTYNSIKLSHNGATLMLQGEQKATSVSSQSTRFGPAFIDITRNTSTVSTHDHGFYHRTRAPPKDTCLNRDGSVVGYIFVANVVAIAYTDQAQWDSLLQAKRFRNDQSFKNLSSTTDIIYNKVFFAEVANGVEQLICFSLQREGCITWFDIHSLQLIESIEFSVDQYMGMKLNSSRNRAVVLGTHCVQIVHLERRQIVKTVYFLTSIPKARQVLASVLQNDNTFFFSDAEEVEVSIDAMTVLIGWDTEHERPLYLCPGTNSKRLRRFAESLTQGINTFVRLSEDARWITVAVSEMTPDGLQKKLCMYDLYKKRACRVIPVHLDSSGCQPMFDISADERILVYRSVFERIKGNSTLFDSLVAMTPYAIEGNIPDFQRLKLSRKTENPDIIKQLSTEFSWPLMNYPDYQDKTLFVHALTNRMSEWVDALYDLGKAEGIPINLRWKELSDEGELIETNALQFAIESRNIPFVESQISQLLERATTAEATAEIFRDCLPELYMSFPNKFMELMNSDAFIAMYGVAPVAVKWDPKPAAKVKKLWRCMTDTNLEAGLLGGKKQAELPCETQFVLLKDVARVGMRGIIRYLLMMQAPSEVFKTKILEWTIAYKWKTYGAEACFTDLLKYLALFVVFYVYAAFLGNERRVGNGLKDYAMIIPVIISSIIAALNLKGEFVQARRYQREAQKVIGDGGYGLKHYLRSQWNWIEVLSYFLMFPLPVLHCLSAATAGGGDAFDEILSVCVSIETLLLCFKILYFAQAFRFSGPLVLALREVILDILFFLCLVFMILVGFGLSFFVLSRHTEEREETFGTLGVSLLTMYTALLGDFDIDAFKDAELVSWFMTPLFVLYTLALMIMLLNLLIGVMSDSFDRVRSAEEAEFLKGRASVIDDYEATLTDEEIEKLESKIGTYLFSMTSTKASQQLEGWSGKIRAFENVVEKHVFARQKQMDEELRAIKNSMANLEQALLPPPP